MTAYRTAVIVAGMAVALSAAHINPSCTVAAEDSAAAGQSGAGAPDSSGDGADVTNVKKTRKKMPPPEPEPLPGQKLTFKQVTSILKGARNLSGRNLSGLKLIGVDLGRCNLKGVDLSHADLERADLGESNLERADLSGANLKMANRRLSGMIGVNLDKADLSGAIWMDGRVCAPGSIGQCRDLSGLQ